MIVDYTVSIGVIIQALVVVAGGLILAGVMQRAVSDLEKDLAGVENDLKDLTKTVASIAVQNQRLNRIEEDIRDLKRGRGYIIEETS